MARRRTNIEIEETYVEAIMRRYGLRTKTEAVHLALERLAEEPMTREEALSMRGARLIDHIPEDHLPPHLEEDG
ncbi:MAG: type II toxin-antitoxin system VapB family antitoxin [Actinobacteria bacterium]|nr:type II toxin-antitoxin system VapB family antitoxin [Actinomycetota bacterium]